jgi:hypothetical protein
MDNVSGYRQQEAAENAKTRQKEKDKSPSGAAAEESMSSQRDQKPSSGPPSPNAQALELMEAVFNRGSPLNPAQQQVVIAALQRDPHFIRECDFSPQKVPDC